MRYSKLFAKTQKEVPSDASLISHKLLHQAGYIRESNAGRYFFLPLGNRVQNKIINVVREEMDAAGAQEMLAPVLHPLSLWQETNRDNSAGFELMKIEDRRGAAFALGGTAEEMFVDVVRKFQISYKDLPFNIYQFSLKFRDEMRARGGLLRVREFIMKDAYSFHTNEEDFKLEYKKMWDAYVRIFEKLGLKCVVVESDNGYIGGDYCHEFVVVSEAGESRFLMTEDGEYAAHEDVAKFYKEDKNSSDDELDLEEVDAVRGNTMEDGVKFHNLPLWQQIKDVVFVDDKGRYILAVIRGDFDVNEVKLKHAVDAYDLRPAHDEEIRSDLGSEPGFISPVGIRNGLKDGVELVIVGDTSLRTVKNAYGGANAKNVDLLNVNIGRDYNVDIEADIAMAEAGFLDEAGKRPLNEDKGIEVGNIFQLGYHYSNKMSGASFVDDTGMGQPFYMGCYGIGIGRTMATIAEVFNDENGLVWPKNVAPFHVYLASVGNDEEVIAKADELYKNLTASGVEVFYDDRDERPGSKFKDADLMGMPLRLVVSSRSLEAGGVEWKLRSAGSEPEIVALSELETKLADFLAN
ncbi:proline--tRNA ligase [Candidatus Peregrinibacteria bacterium CG10_big_fil_rev_8_21_14_0_10_36_19]|nr:MAG: proline--tRNA ligase [Candidatus Peregrinibacteria bacterium CG10_big_fil_rev_8_21_14_0_10_36_19]